MKSLAVVNNYTTPRLSVDFSIKETRNIENIAELHLNSILCQFFINARARKGTLYEPDTLTQIDLREGTAFIKFREILASRRKELTKLGR